MTPDKLRDDDAATPERDEMLERRFAQLETPEHAEGFFQRLETRLSAVDAERRGAAGASDAATRVVTRRPWSWQRWTAAGTAVVATAAALAIAFVAIDRAGGPKPESVAQSSARSALTAPQTFAGTASGGALSSKAPQAGAAGPNGSADRAPMPSYVPPQASAAVSEPLTPAQMIAAHNVPPERRVSASQAATALGGRLRLPSAGLVGMPLAYFTYTAPWRTKPEVTVVFSGGFQLTSSAGRDVAVYYDPANPSATASRPDTRHPDQRFAESLRPPDYAALVAEQAQGNPARPNLASVAGRDGMLEYGYTQDTGPYLGSLVWYDGRLFQDLMYFGEPKTLTAGVGLKKRMIAAGESMAR